MKLVPGQHRIVADDDPLSLDGDHVKVIGRRKTGQELEVVPQAPVVITKDQVLLPHQSIGYRDRLIDVPMEREVAEVIDMVIRADHPIPVGDHHLIHLRDVLERSPGILYYP